MDSSSEISATAAAVSRRLVSTGPRTWFGMIWLDFRWGIVNGRPCRDREALDQSDWGSCVLQKHLMTMVSWKLRMIGCVLGATWTIALRSRVSTTQSGSGYMARGLKFR